MVEATVPRLIHDPGIFDLDLLEDLLAAIGERLSRAKSITEGILVVGRDEIKLSSILFDTGALHKSYISQELVNRYRDQWRDNLIPNESLVRLADQRTVIGSKEELKAQLTIYGNSSEQFTAELELVVWSMRGMDMIIGLPDITNFYKDK